MSGCETPITYDALPKAFDRLLQDKPVRCCDLHDCNHGEDDPCCSEPETPTEPDEAA